MRHFLLIAAMNAHGQRFFNSENQRCNICDRKPWFWLPRGHDLPVINSQKIMGAGKRFVDCPFCRSSDRDRLIYEAFKQNLDTLEKGNVLHVAPEKALWKAFSNWGWNRYGLDARTKGYRFSYNSEVLLGTLCELPFVNSYFSLIVANHVLEHIEDEAKALSEILRVLKPGGIACLQVPFSQVLDANINASEDWDSQKRKDNLGQWDHVRLYGKNYLKNWLKLGFERLNIEIAPDIRHTYRINTQEPLIFLRKIN